ncbi:MAG: hypothetical protein ACI8T1_003843 [Verrucomicrobiales bacterium]
MEYEPEPIAELRGGTANVLEGTKASFQATTSRDLAKAEIDDNPAKTEGRRVMSETMII